MNKTLLVIKVSGTEATEVQRELHDYMERLDYLLSIHKVTYPLLTGLKITQRKLYHPTSAIIDLPRSTERSLEVT